MDGGGLCAAPDSRFGNYVFSLNLIKALGLYDKQNQYSVYSFCSKPSDLKVEGNLNYKVLRPRKFWMSARVSIEENLQKKDIFLALNQAVPTTSAKLLGFSHGLSFHYHSSLYPKSYSKLRKQLEILIKTASRIIVSSSKVKNELKSNFGKTSGISVLPCGIPFDFQTYTKRKRKKFFLFVGIDHPIKNVAFIQKAFNEFKMDKRFSEYKLLKVQSTKVSRAKLKKLYQEAAGYLTSSLYESFNLPVLEALSQNCPVVGLRSAIIPELEKYVSIAKNPQDFVELMKKLSMGNSKSIDRKRLKEEFSWSLYVSKLTDIYLSI